MEEDKFFEKMAEAPAVALEKTLDVSRQLNHSFAKHSHLKKAKEFWHNLGPGLTTGAADDDPSGIATYSQTGSQYGFQLIWLSLFTFPFMAIVQEMCARIGLVTGQGLAANIRKYYPKWVLYLCSGLLFVANTLNLGADIGAMAKATQLIVHFPFEMIVLFFSLLCLLLQIFTTYDKFAKFLKYLALVLLSYVLVAFMVDLNWGEILKRTVIPSMTFSKDQIFLVCGILGTTISPYLFFWQTSQEVEEQILGGKTTVAQRAEITTDKEVKEMRIDVWSGMFASNLVMFFIIAATAATLFAHGITNINTAADAAKALEPLAGKYTFLLFALGVIGTGMLAVPVLAGSASYALSESFGWKYGLYKKLKQAYAFYGVIIIAMAIGIIINLLNIDNIKALIYSAVANGLIAPVVLILITLLSSNKKVMGERANHPVITFLAWVITGLMVISGIAALIGMFL